MDRLGLKALMAGIKNGKIDVVVVYKVDWLSRSLNDFAQMMNVFDAYHAAIQYHDLDGSADAEYPAQLRPVRARSNW
jgi:DNA invertase Pin-like site-specific DNA recombinase